MQPAVAPHQGRGGAGRFFNFRRMKRILRHILPVILCLPALGGCMKWDYADMEEFAATGPGLFITNEGNFQYGNATLSYYDPATKKVENEVFYRANAMKLGDVAQSMTIHNDLGWIVVNNSHVVFAIDLRTFKEVGRITNLIPPSGRRASILRSSTAASSTKPIGKSSICEDRTDSGDIRIK